MTTLYSKKNSLTERPSENAVLSVNDNSSQSKSLQRKADMANATAQRAEAPRPNNTGMPDNLKSGIESLSGFSMDDVRVHYNSSKPATVQALAYTQGTDIHVAPGQEKHLPHEAWHVAQQMAGRVSPTTNINGMPVNDNAGLEHEADVMGEKAASQNNSIITFGKNKSIDKTTLQLAPGRFTSFDLVCAADVWYQYGGNLHKAKGVGFNNFRDADRVLDLFQDKGFIDLATIAQPANSNNPPGQCAEPHALADALNKDPNIRFDNVIDIFISDSVIRKRKYHYYNGINNRLNAQRGITDNRMVYALERCPTCRQWIDKSGHVKINYLNRATRARVRNAANVKNSRFPEKLRFLQKPSKEGTNVSISGIPSQLNYFHNANILASMRYDDRIDFALWNRVINDFCFQAINDHSGLRTIIKKQMLKNRVYELIPDNATRLLLYTAIEEAAFRIKNERPHDHPIIQSPENYEYTLDGMP